MTKAFSRDILGLGKYTHANIPIFPCPVEVTNSITETTVLPSLCIPSRSALYTAAAVNRKYSHSGHNADTKHRKLYLYLTSRKSKVWPALKNNQLTTTQLVVPLLSHSN